LLLAKNWGPSTAAAEIDYNPNIYAESGSTCRRKTPQDWITVNSKYHQSPGLAAPRRKPAQLPYAEQFDHKDCHKRHRQSQPQPQRQRRWTTGRLVWISLVNQAVDRALAWGLMEAGDAESNALRQLKGK
jgi:hypothetical protein